MTENRRRLYQHLKENQHILSDDPLFHTKTFLRQHSIPEKEFFHWIIEEGQRYNFSVNSDRSVMWAMI